MTAKKAELTIFNETDYPLPFEESALGELTALISRKEKRNFAFIEVVYVNEDEIIRINKEHLERDYITDIITFSYCETDDTDNIEGTLYCCAPRIAEQAAEFDQPVQREFLRVFIHGLLHLVGYDDKEPAQKKAMRARENEYLKAKNL